MSTAYDRLLELSRRQHDAAARDDIAAVITLMNERVRILTDAKPATDSDHQTIAEVLRLDRDVATAIRKRMLAVRNEAVSLQNGRTALRGYTPPLGERRARRLNVFG